MFALEVEFLMGRVLASAHDDRRSVEWPPHPTRIFSALVAAYEECDLGSEAREALEWLEVMPPPMLYANPPDHERWSRDVHSVFVPVNDHESDEPESARRSNYWEGKITKDESYSSNLTTIKQVLAKVLKDSESDTTAEAVRVTKAVLEIKGLGFQKERKKKLLERAVELETSRDRDKARDLLADLYSELVSLKDDSLSAALSVFPERRDRQERWFPAFTPCDQHVWLIWKQAERNERHVQALQRVAENVTYIGHSMSPVRMRVWQPGNAPPPTPTLAPHPAGTLMLRTTGKGRLEHLENVYRLRKENATIQPRLGRVTAYRKDAPSAVPASLFRHGYIFRHVAGTRLSLESTSGLVNAIRRAVIGRYPDPVPEVICGHDESGRKTDAPHLVIAPLADVGHRHADGHIMGLGLWLPASTPAEVLECFEDAMSGLRELKLGKAGIWQIEAVDATQASRVLTLRLRTYEGPSDTWASVTPVIFGKYPKRSQVGPGKDGGKVFAELCEMIGLPRPVEIRVGSVSVFRSAPKAAHFAPPAKFADRLRAHVWVRFPVPVRGPVLLGAARFVGFGLCRPWRT